MITTLSLEEFLIRSAGNPVLDVRSPSEYQQAHIPGAYNLPLFTDEERKIVGTAYKQQSRKHAIRHGLDFFGVKMRAMVEEAERLLKAPAFKNQAPVLFVHCWRGGMRSNAVAWLLDVYGFEVCLLEGGYKTFRNWVLDQFEKDYPLKIVGGYTGSGKTLILSQLEKEGETVIDLEKIASHKGSAFGALGQPPQPRQEMFENLLAVALQNAAASGRTIWLEDESQRIGVLNIPAPFWQTMRQKPVYFIDIPFDPRLDYITTEYGCHEKERLVNAIIRIQKRLGPMETKTAIGHLLENDHREAFRILLAYYDRLYGKALYNRENIGSLLNKIPVSSVDTVSNTKSLLACQSVST